LQVDAKLSIMGRRWMSTSDIHVSEGHSVPGYATARWKELDVRFRVIISMDAFERRRLNCKVNEDRIELWLQERLVRSTSLTGLKWVSGRLQLDQMVQEVLRDKAG